jgi:UPF0755 protein
MDNTPLIYISESEPEPSFVPEFKIPKGDKAKPPRKVRRILFLGTGTVILLFLLSIHLHVASPSNFPKDTIVSVKSGQTLRGFSQTLEETNVIKSKFAFKSLVYLFGGGKGLRAGDYYLEKSQNAITLAWRFSNSRYNLKNIRITIPEGFSVIEIADIFKREKKFNYFSADQFKKLAAKYEGYLFPDTYLFLPNITAQGVIDAMLLNYQKRVEPLAAEVFVFGRPIKDVINMASIIEEEARTLETREIIAGILWKRLDMGMALQVDSAFAFVNGEKDSKDLSLEDLKIESPYNTYLHVGLPPTPISNPGINAIKATINPIKTKYYYYLSDDDGNMHYAITHDEHVMNKQKYLR